MNTGSFDGVKNSLRYLLKNYWKYAAKILTGEKFHNITNVFYKCNTDLLILNYTDFVNMDKHDYLLLEQLPSSPHEATTVHFKQLVMLHISISKISEIQDYQEIPQAFISEVLNTFPVVACSIRLWDQEQRTLSLLEDGGSDKGEYSSTVSKLSLDDYPILNSVLMMNKIKQIVIDDQTLSANEYDLLKNYGAKSLLLIPLRYQNEVIGLIEIYDRETKTYEEVELVSLKLLANYAINEVENKRSHSQLERSITEQKALQESTLLITNKLDLEEILIKIAEQIGILMNATSVYISAYDPIQKISRAVVEYYGPDANEKEKVSDIGDVYDHHSDYIDIGHIFEDGDPIMYSIDDPGMAESDRAYIKKFGGNSAIEIPLKVGGEFMSIIEIWDSRKSRIFTGEEIAICKTIASHAAFAIKNAQLFKSMQDEINERKRLEDQLRYDALHDSLTNVPNRTLFMDRLQQAILRKKRSSDVDFLVLYLDLDKFKQVNDTFGHRVGDKLLVQVAQTLKNCVRAGDTVSRFGGDEFLILLEGEITSASVKTITDRIQSNLKEISLGTKYQLYQTASIGLVASSPEIESAEDYIKYADIAMYGAKTNGGARTEIFSQTKKLLAKKKIIMQAELREAVKKRELDFHLQPILEVESGQVKGFEVLLRWQNKTGKMIPPSIFVPLLEELGLLSEVGFWVVEEAISYFSEMEKKNPGFSDVTLSVNVSINQLIHPKFLKYLEKTLNKNGFDPNRLVIEITESVFINDWLVVIDILNDIRKLGVKVHLDDFGTGFSSLSYLIDLPLDGLKLDRKFIGKSNNHNEQKGVLATILGLAQELNLGVIAEGIENEEQLSVLKQLKCQYCQGFLFSPGISKDALEIHVQKSGLRFSEESEPSSNRIQRSYEKLAENNGQMPALQRNSRKN